MKVSLVAIAVAVAIEERQEAFESAQEAVKWNKPMAIEERQEAFESAQEAVKWNKPKLGFFGKILNKFKNF